MFRSIRELLDLALGSFHYLHPLVDDYLCEFPDEEDHADVQERSGDYKDIKCFTCEDHVDQLICHCYEVGELTEGNERFFAGQCVDHDNAGHYES